MSSERPKPGTPAPSPPPPAPRPPAGPQQPSRAIQPGASLLALNAMGDWMEAIAVTAPEGTHDGHKRIHDFPVVWVKFTTKGVAFPWPLEDVRAA